MRDDLESIYAILRRYVAESDAIKATPYPSPEFTALVRQSLETSKELFAAVRRREAQ